MSELWLALSALHKRWEEIDKPVKGLLTKSIEGDCLHLWIDANYLKMHQAGRIRRFGKALGRTDSIHKIIIETCQIESLLNTRMSAKEPRPQLIAAISTACSRKTNVTAPHFSQINAVVQSATEDRKRRLS